ncbi:putative receptor-like protein kinase [Cardamine amara subsp. amara]|uniref:Receptor-like protein kinase n=1 Tax=Cardamine amara subsp. amara TaxID=228776 RepID=A0ABD1C4P0_CARAN
MKNICFRNSVSLFLTMVIIVLLPHLTLSQTRPEKFYINCGSDSTVSYGGVDFVGDTNSSGNGSSVSFTRKGTEVFENKESTAPEIYRTVRIFKQTSSYNLQLDVTGLHIVRFHFSAVSSRTDLLTASFTISATSDSKQLLKSSPLQNFSETPRVEEFLLMMNSTKFEIRFVPDRPSLAFVNAIEVFFIRNDLEKLPDPEKNLHTIYRLNVGGKLITPVNDTLGRTWLPNDDFLYQRESATNRSTTQPLNYLQGSKSATTLTAPDFVYQTAKTQMYNQSDSNKQVQTLINVTWTFKVQSNYTHFLRFHFCDILNNSESSDFYLYINGNWRQDVKPSGYGPPLTPFFIDLVNVSDGSGTFNISISDKEINKPAAFLNGVEVMEVLGKSGSDSSDKNALVPIIAGSVAAAAVSVLVLSLLFMVFLKRRRRLKKTKPDNEVTVWSPLPVNRGGSSDNRTISTNYNSPLRNLHLGLTIPFQVILRATNNFDERWLIGKGGFGDVYKAILRDGTKAAIKRGKTGSGQGILEFQTEIQVLSRIRHRHLVSLTGYCEENSEMILVYEYMEKGTLKEHLYGSDFPPLTWKQRLEICIGAARGLHYLHSGSEGAIIHRDVKSTNILLDENNVAKVADFGLSKLTVRNQDPTNISTNIKGTFGYLDPEYLQTHILTEKSDVYAFGVVLLEVLFARPALDRNLPHEEVNLAEWAMFCNSKGIIDEILDPRLIGQIEPSSMRKFMEIAEKCLREYGDERPSMGDVIWDLEYVLQLQMMTTVRREPHEDSTATISDASFVVPRLMVSDSFSSNSIVQMDRSKNRYGSRDSSENRVFSQLKISEAR